MNIVDNIDEHGRSECKNKVAFYFTDGTKEEKYTFREVSNLSNKFANVLTGLGIEKGDRVFIFLPRVPELYISFLGIMKTGAIAGTMFSAFGSEGLYDRLYDSGAKYLITDSTLKERVYEIKDKLPNLEKLIIVEDNEFEYDEGALETKYTLPDEVDYHLEMKSASEKFDVVKMKPNEPAFMLYTSGTTGKPKGVVHGHSAIEHQISTTKHVLTLNENDIYWCTADPGWITGISYGIIGPLSCGVTSLVYSGRFSPDNWYSLIEKYGVTVWYSAPTAYRMLMNSDVHRKYDMTSLRHILSVGEPLNAEIIKWSRQRFGLPIYDSYWQTETGGMLVANYPPNEIKDGWMGTSVPGISAGIVDDNGQLLPRNTEGNLAIVPNFSSLMLDIWKNRVKYNEYFKNGWYLTGDKAMQSVDGYFLFIGRDDDLINTSGERVGPFEVESVLLEHPDIVEAGVIGKPDKLRGEIIKAFIVLTDEYRGEYKPDISLVDEIKKFVKSKLAGHAYPREIEFVDSLPKTRSGKIMRRMLKAKELGLEIGDTSTLED